MEPKPRAQSSRGTPLTVRWTEGSIEGKPVETQPGVDMRRLATLVSAFVIGLGVFGLSSWLLGERLWVVHSLLGGYLSCVWLQRFGEKHFGWHTAETNERVTSNSSASEIRKQRLAYSVPGVAIGIAAVGLTAWFTGGPNWVFDAVMGIVGGYELGIGFGERFRGLPTLHDLAVVRLREEMSPLDLKAEDRVPATLKTAKEVKAKR